MSDPKKAIHTKLFWSRCRGFAVSIFVLLLLQWLDFTGWLPLVNGRIVDNILRLRSSNAESAASRNIYTIGIDDQAYRNFFQSNSPMNYELVLALVKTVADANPKVIGVDIRTEGPGYAKSSSPLNNLPSSIVWISAFKVVEPLSSVATFPAWLFGASDRTIVSPLPVLGRSPFSLPDQRQTHWGIPLYPRDEDDSVRRFPRTVNVLRDHMANGSNTSDITTEPSWAARVAGLYCEPRCQKESADEVYLSYAGYRSA